MTNNDRRALRILATMGETRAGDFGAAMSPHGHRPPQSYARSGGKALGRLVRLGYAEQYNDSHRGGSWGWRITTAGQDEARRQESP